jgi:hypothetical protein
MDAMENSSLPTSGVFKDPAAMLPIVQFLAGNGEHV